MVRYLQSWMDQLRWQRLRPFQKLAEMLLDHLDGILNYCRTRVPLGVVEAVNGNIKLILALFSVSVAIAAGVKAGGASHTGAWDRRPRQPDLWASRRVAPRRITQPAAGEPAAVFAPPPTSDPSRRGSPVAAP